MSCCFFRSFSLSVLGSASSDRHSKTHFTFFVINNKQKKKTNSSTVQPLLRHQGGLVRLRLPLQGPVPLLAGGRLRHLEQVLQVDPRVRVRHLLGDPVRRGQGVLRPLPRRGLEVRDGDDHRLVPRVRLRPHGPAGSRVRQAVSDGLGADQHEVQVRCCGCFEMFEAFGLFFFRVFLFRKRGNGLFSSQKNSKNSLFFLPLLNLKPTTGVSTAPLPPPWESTSTTTSVRADGSVSSSRRPEAPAASSRSRSRAATRVPGSQ